MAVERTLVTVARDTEDVAGGLRVFRDALSEDATHITGIIGQLYAISALLTRLDEHSQHPQFRGSFHRIKQPMSLVLYSLKATQKCAFDMFGRSRNLSHRRVWEDFSVRMEDDEGASLEERLGWYRLALEASLHLLREERSSINRRALCEQIAELLQVQDELDHVVRRRSQPHIQYRHVEPLSPTFSDMDGRRPHFPYAPDPPLSPTYTVSSSQTLDSSHTSYSNMALSPSPPHWAQDVFNGQYPATEFRRGYEVPGASQCLEQQMPDALQKLAQEGYHRALELQFDGETTWVRFYHRPSDNRARILFMSSRNTFYCAQLAQLKAIRRQSSIWLCRVQTNGHLRLWANLNFAHYERMVLFYSTFVAMKRQDTEGNIHAALKEDAELEEDLIFHGQIQHNQMLHALKLYYDQASGVLRLEASPLRGSLANVPLWTAFVTKYCQRGDEHWAQLHSGSLVTLSALKPPPFVFLAGYLPPRTQHEWVLHFTSKNDARGFINSWVSLCRGQR